MVISQQSYGKTNQMTGPIDMLLQAVALALAVSYWSVRWAVRQSVMEGLRDE